MAQPWQTGTVIRIEQETDATRRYWIRVEDTTDFVFKPGQFVTLDLPIHEKVNKRWRSYSIASWPDGTNVFELVIVLLEGGAGTTWIFNEVQVGSTLTFRGPQGVFVLPEVIDRDLFLICTGTGIAPFRSMAHHILNHGIESQNIYLIFGCRTMQDCLYGRELKALEEKMPSFKYIPTFSREKPGESFRTGYVHAIYEELCGKREGCEPQSPETLRPAYFYLCGWKQMIDEARQRITAIGYDRKAIHLELYG